MSIGQKKKRYLYIATTYGRWTHDLSNCIRISHWATGNELAYLLEDWRLSNMKLL